MLRVPVSVRGVLLPRWLVVVLVGLVSISLCFSTESPAAAQPSEPSSPAPAVPTGPGEVEGDSDGDGSPDRPDAVAAAVMAAVLDEPVEDLSQRSESGRVVANPDGSFTEEAFGAPMWVQDAEGTWVDVDYTLVPSAAGGFVPKAAPTNLVIDGGTREFARLVLDDETETIWSWPQALPTPSLDGPVASYAVADGVDLVVTATARGVSTRIRVNTPEAVVPDFRVKVRTVGASLEKTDDGALVVTDGDAENISAATAPLVAWDARTDAWGDPVKVVSVDAGLVETASSGDRTDHVLTLPLPAELVDDPEVVYPITIDPDMSGFAPMQDTWVRSGVGWISSLYYRLIVGASEDHANSNPAISYLQWDNGRLRNRTISSAEVGFFQYMAATCSNRTVMVYPLTSAWNEATTQYSNRPSVNGAVETRSSWSTNIGASGCTPAGGWVKANVTAMAQEWAQTAQYGGFTNYGLQLSVPSANQYDFSFERRLCSGDYDPSHTSCNSASKVPYLKSTYTNLKPYPPSAPTITSGSRAFDGKQWTATTSPRFSTSSMAHWGATIKMTYEVHANPGSSPVITSCTSASVDHWLAAPCAVSGLISGNTYAVRARAIDNNGLTSDWSPWLEFGIDTVTPARPTITCPGYADKSWSDQPGAATTACTFTSAGSADFEWSLYQPAAFVPQPALIASGGSATAPPITIPEAGGYFMLKVKGRSKAGVGSSERAYSFGVASPQLTLPNVDDRSTSTFQLQAVASSNPTNAESAIARVEWRRPPENGLDTTTGWQPATGLTRQDDGEPWDGSVTKPGAIQTPILRWDASKEPDVEAPALLQVRVVFTYPD